jgi:hypothetical protein
VIYLPHRSSIRFCAVEQVLFASLPSHSFPGPGDPLVTLFFLGPFLSSSNYCPINAKMVLATAAILATLAASVSAKDSRTFAVNHFYGKGPLVEGRMDPIVSPGVPSGHAHTIQGGSAFAMTLGDTTLLSSTCTSSLIANDKSAYWTPKMYFYDEANNTFEDVPMFYMNVYYL